MANNIQLFCNYFFYFPQTEFFLFENRFLGDEMKEFLCMLMISRYVHESENLVFIANVCLIVKIPFIIYEIMLMKELPCVLNG